MPPKRNINKQKQISRKKEITLRLMAISLKVDKYIYKNKLIPFSEAQMYLEELRVFRSLCLGDAPSLQVCEKLSRCIRGIIEEQQSNHAVLEDTEPIIDLNHSCYMNAESPVYSLADNDKTYMDSELIPELQPENKKSTINNNNNTNIGIESNDGLKKSVRFCIDDQIKHNSVVTEPVNVTHEIATDFNKDNLLNDNTHRPYNVDDELTDEIVDLTLEDIEQPTVVGEDMCSQSILKNLETNDKAFDEYCNNDTCGQDMAEFDREITNLINNEAQGNNLEPKIAPVTQTTSKTTTKMPVIVKTAETANKPKIIPNIHKTKRLRKKKLTQDEKVQKKSITKNKNKENKQPKKRRKNNPDLNNTKSKINTQVFTPLTSNSNVALPALSNINNETKNASKITQNTSKNNIEMRYDPIIVQPAEIKNITNTVPNAGPIINNKKSSNVVCFEEDLSWVENLTYVREIHLEEYDSTFKPYSESFWDNCDLPDNWGIQDFE